jgi:hypothetical protein
MNNSSSIENGFSHDGPLRYMTIAVSYSFYVLHANLRYSGGPNIIHITMSGITEPARGGSIF